jgi:signal transduction histidine kinase
MALRRNIRIDVNLDSRLDVVTLDERKFKQVLYNLLSNAVKFSHENGKIEVSAGEGLGQICLQVKDFGIGIKKEDLPRLFRAFEQLGAGTARQHEGSGLGLALTKKIVELQQGTIDVESEFGKGSTFTVTLPDRFREL